MRANDGLEQRIARQPVRAVQAGAGHFTDGIEPRNLGFAVHVRHDAAALVVRRRNDRDGLPGDVDPVLEAGLVDVRKPLENKLRRPVRDIEHDEIRAALFHLAVDGARDDVPRGQ